MDERAVILRLTRARRSWVSQSRFDEICDVRWAGDAYRNALRPLERASSVVVERYSVKPTRSVVLRIEVKIYRQRSLVSSNLERLAG